MLVYSRPGIGKTQLLCSAADVPSMCDVLYVDCEKGEMTLYDNPYIKNWEHLIQNRVAVSTFPEVARIHDWLTGHCRARDAAIAGNQDALKALAIEEQRMWGLDAPPSKPKLIRTVIIDTLTEVNMMSNYELLGVTEAKVLAGNAEEIEVATWDEFRKNNQRINMLVKAFRNLPLNFLVAAHEQYKQDELKKFHYEPGVTGQLARQIQGAFDIVGYYVQQRINPEKTERRLYIQPVANFDAKNRRPTFKADFFNESQLSMAAIMKETGLLK
jgi:hypothetical protein